MTPSAFYTEPLSASLSPPFSVEGVVGHPYEFEHEGSRQRPSHV